MIDFFLHLLLASGSFCNFESHHCKRKIFCLQRINWMSRNIRPSTCIFCFRFIGRLLNLIYPLIIIEDNKTNLVTKFNLFCLAISNSYQILLCLLLLLMTKIINDQNIWYTLMDLICKKQIKDNQPHILVPSLQKLGQSIPSCTHTVIYNKMYV